MMNTYDFKKAEKQYYQPTTDPSIIQVEAMSFLAYEGIGNPNELHGEYQSGLAALYATAYALRMSKKNQYHIEGYFEYVVPPLEGLWYQNTPDSSTIDYQKKDLFHFTSLLRLPAFVSSDDVSWAIQEVFKKKHVDASKVTYRTIEEGLCVQCMHLGSYDDEPRTMQKIDEFLIAHDYRKDFHEQRLHHEIYISDPRRCDPLKQKTIIRLPIKPKD